MCVNFVMIIYIYIRKVKEARMIRKPILLALIIVLCNLLLAGVSLWHGTHTAQASLSLPVAAWANLATNAQVGACSYISPDGSVSGQISLTLDECAKAIYDETLRLGLYEGYGLFDKYALRVAQNGDVYAAQTDMIYSTNELNWQFLGNIAGNRAGAQTSQPVMPASNPVPVVQDSPVSSNRDEVSGTVPTSLEQIFDIAAEDINDFWDATFKEYGYDYTEPQIVLFDRSQVSTGCGVAPAQVGPFYCNIDHTMYYPYNFMYQQWQRFGDYAVVTIIAHEWGHSVQNMLGALSNGSYTIDIELQADCFAGAYTQYANESSTKIRLDAQDIEEGAVALFNAGDPDGTPWWDSQAHGSGDLRYQAFEDGFKMGVNTC